MAKDINKQSRFVKIIKKVPISEDVLRMVSSFFGSNMLVLIIQAVSGLLVTRMVSPEDMGNYLTASILLTYIPFLTLGINNGLNRQLPFLTANGENDEAISLSNTAYTWSIITGMLILLISCILSIHSFYNLKNALGVAYLGVGITAALLPLTQMIESTYKTNNDFSNLSRSRLYTSLLAILTIPIVYFWQFIGYIIRTSFLSISNIFLLISIRKIQFNIRFKQADFIQLFRVGMPIFIFGYFHSIYLGLDKVFIAHYLTEKEMGLYAPALQVSAALAVLPSSIFQILYPRMCRKYGETGRVSSLSKMAFMPIIYLGFGLIPFFTLGYWLVGPFIEWALPNYASGIPAARWMVVTMYIWCLGSAQDVLTTIGKFFPFTIALVVSGIIYFITCYYLIRMDWGLSAVSASFALSMFTFNAVVTYSVYLIIKKDRALIANER